MLFLLFVFLTSSARASIVELIELGAFEEAEKQLLEQLEVTSNEVERIWLRTLYGDVWFYRNQFDQAIGQYRQALGLAQVINNKSLQAEQMKNIAIAFSELKFYGKALSWHEQAKSTLDFKLVNNTGMSVLLSQAMIFNQVGAPELAMETLNQAQNIAFQLSNDSALNNSFLRLASFYVGNESYSEAKSRLQKVDLNSFKNMDDLLWYYQLRLLVELSLNNLPAAEDVLKQFKLVTKDSEYFHDIKVKLLTVHLLLKSGHLDAADEMISTLEQSRDVDSWQIKSLKAQRFKTQNKHLAAFDFYQQAVDLFFTEYAKEKQAGVYVDLPTPLLKATIAAAVDIGFDDLNKVFTWLNWLYVAKQPKFANQSKVEHAVQNVGSDLGLSEVMTDVMQGPVSMKHNNDFNLLTLQKALRKDEGFVFFIHINNQLLALLVGPSKAELIELHHDFLSLNDQISQFVNLLVKNDAWLPLSQELERQLIHPLRSHGLDRFKKLHIVPDENLRFLPFDVLLDEQGAMMLDKHIISFHTIHSLPQFMVYRKMGVHQSEREKPSKTNRMSFVGTTSAMAQVPSYWRTAYRNLDFQNQPTKGAKKEHAMIKSMGLDGRIWLNQTATETNAVDIIKNETGVLHVASHGFDNPVAPAFSSLVLAANKQDDGLLQAREVSKLNSQLSLVVLASCSSAKGGLQGRYGFQLGLSEAFLQAGVRSVVGTLWDVKDQKTFQFMQWFYQSMKEVKQPLLALNAAKQQAIKEHWLAADWSAFILLGDGSNHIDLNFRDSTSQGQSLQWLKLLLFTLLLIVLIFIRKISKK